MRKQVFLFFFFAYLQTIHASEIPKIEIRAVWLTTIYGLDWPSKPATNDITRKQQQQELCNKLDKLQEANFNTVFLQVRMRGDVIYPSKIEPFNRVFSGKTGKSPGYDPLAFAIEECHKRGMECHAWFVTFPLGTDKYVKDQGANSVVKKQPLLCKRHNKEWYLDPGLPETKHYLQSMVKEIVANYNIDGIHFDYIRYPEEAARFPDKNTYQQYGKKKEIQNWRRENINMLVSSLYDSIKSIKSWVQVSSSPLGKYNRISKVPNAGWTAYESVFQDPKRWMDQDKHDMVVPMMYYLHDNFFPFVDNWVENNNGRLIVPGLGAYRMDKAEGDWSINDITDQIDYSRQYGIAGFAFFRCATIVNNTKGIYDELRDNYFRHPALLPPLTWLNKDKPIAPKEIRVDLKENALRLSWEKSSMDNQQLTYTIYSAESDTLDAKSSKNILVTGLYATEYELPIDLTKEKEYTFRVSSSTRYHIESDLSYDTYYYQTKYIK